MSAPAVSLREPSPALYIDTLVSGFPAKERDSRGMFFLQGAFDDSGSDLNAPFYVLAGFVANVGQWKRFSDRWQEKLDAEPSIVYFKMSEAMSLNEQFAGWPAAHRDQKIFELAEIIRDFVEMRVYCSLFRADFDAVVTKLIPRSEFCDPYFLCFHDVIFSVAGFLERGGVGRGNVDWRSRMCCQAVNSTLARRLLRASCVAVRWAAASCSGPAHGSRGGRSSSISSESRRRNSVPESRKGPP
jgi:hypothetical protein